MANDVKPRVKVPSKAAAGEVVTIKTLISHPMESGQRKDKDGNLIPRSIINRFVCDFNGVNVIDMTLDPAISTNPYIEFDAVMDRQLTKQLQTRIAGWNRHRNRQPGRHAAC